VDHTSLFLACILLLLIYQVLSAFYQSRSAIQVLRLLSFTLGDTASSPLNKRNYKHIYLITFISAGFNAILVNLYLSRNELNFPGLITDIEQVSRFFVGDIIGTVLVFVSLSYILKPIIAQSRN
jgi:hypothetical protein